VNKLTLRPTHHARFVPAWKSGFEALVALKKNQKLQLPNLIVSDRRPKEFRFALRGAGLPASSSSASRCPETITETVPPQGDDDS